VIPNRLCIRRQVLWCVLAPSFLTHLLRFSPRKLFKLLNRAFFYKSFLQESYCVIIWRVLGDEWLKRSRMLVIVPLYWLTFITNSLCTRSTFITSSSTIIYAWKHKSSKLQFKQYFHLEFRRQMSSYSTTLWDTQIGLWGIGSTKTSSISSVTTALNLVMRWTNRGSLITLCHASIWSYLS
jgi:hypothetical protein